MQPPRIALYTHSPPWRAKSRQQNRDRRTDRLMNQQYERRGGWGQQPTPTAPPTEIKPTEINKQGLRFDGCRPARAECLAKKRTTKKEKGEHRHHRSVIWGVGR